MKALDIAVVQGQIKWHDSKANIDHFSKILGAYTIEVQRLIVLPEMWSTGFTMKAEKYAYAHDAALDKMKEWSNIYSSAVMGSLIAKVDNKFYNRLYCIDNGSVIDWYDKRHLFAFAGENISFTKGNDKKIVELDGWKICLNICYDLRFPVWSRNYEDYDILLYTANWPDKRLLAWDSLLRARAIENQCYVIGANCIGRDVWNNEYSGYSKVYSFDGEALTEFTTKETIIKASLDKVTLEQFRKSFPFLNDKDQLSEL